MRRLRAWLAVWSGWTALALFFAVSTSLTYRSAGRPAKGQSEPTVLDRRGKPIQKPSLERVFRRAGIFGPILLAFVYFTARDQLTLAGVVLNTAILLAFFMPFSYLVDTLVYRTMMKRAGRDPRTGRKGR